MPSFKRQSMAPKTRRVGRLLLGAVACLTLFLGGYALGQSRPASTPRPPTASSADVPVGAPKGLSKDVNFALFWQVWNTVKAHYVGQPVSDKDLFHGAVAGMVESLGDPYSVYLPPTLADEFTNDLKGTFEGIGAEIGIKDDVVTVIAPLPDTPADKAGIRAGDRILAIDATSTAGMTVDTAVSLIRGKGGTVVTLSLLHPGAKDLVKVPVTRQSITVKSVQWSMKKTADGAAVGYVQIRQFNDDTTPLFAQAVRELMKDDPKGIIIDLRNDPGGYLDAATQVAGSWLDGTTVIEKKYDGTETPLAAEGDRRLAGVPTVVLVNGGSASAAEILSGALQDDKAATLVGTQTFGKGSVQDYQELPDGGALKLTVAEWLTPKRRSINKEGIAPDVTVELTEEDANADKDPQLDKALQLIGAGTAAHAVAAH